VGDGSRRPHSPGIVSRLPHITHRSGSGFAKGGQLAVFVSLAFGHRFSASRHRCHVGDDVMLAMIPMFLRDTMKLSNRFAGPMFRLKTSLGCLMSGEQHLPIKFREEDRWREAASDFHQVLERVERLQAENEAFRS
jgi:hypothetical protein